MVRSQPYAKEEPSASCRHRWGADWGLGRWLGSHRETAGQGEWGLQLELQPVGGASGKEPACHCRRQQRRRFHPWDGKIPWRKACFSTPAFLPGESHGQGSLAGYSPLGSQRAGHDRSGFARSMALAAAESLGRGSLGLAGQRDPPSASFSATSSPETAEP